MFQKITDISMLRRPKRAMRFHRYTEKQCSPRSALQQPNEFLSEFYVPDIGGLTPRSVKFLNIEKIIETGFDRVIIVDDGSTDATTEVLQRCCAGSPMPIRVIHQEESGFPVALNRGVHEATGRWIVFLDHDLLASPKLIARHVRAQEHLGGEACIVGRVAVHPKLKGGTLTRFLMPQERYTLV